MGNKYILNKLTFFITCTLKSSRMSIESGEYKNYQFAYGTTQNIFINDSDTSKRKVMVSFIKNKDDVKGAVLIPSPNNNSSRII